MQKVVTTTEAGRAAHLARHDVTISTAAEKLLDTKERARKAADALNNADAPLFADAPPVEKIVHITLHAIMDDFPFDVDFNGTADQLAATVKRLRDLGAVPPTYAARAAVEAEKERSAPVCEFHGPMKESTKRPGTFYCPAKMGNGDYCKSKG